jgi:hypothetical protein
MAGVCHGLPRLRAYLPASLKRRRGLSAADAKL